jgi:geranylgeranyl pyrophosphate synthase
VRLILSCELIIMVSAETLRTFLQQIPELADWPVVAEKLDEVFTLASHDWHLPVLVCQAVGGTEHQAVPAAMAIAMCQMGIIVVDDMLDHEPDGAHHELGIGPAANISLALQAGAFQSIAIADIDGDTKAAVMASLAHMNLRTAYGQHLDVQNYTGEEAYWRVTATKSTPFYGCAYEIGALMGGASTAIARQLYDIGVTLGELIQVEDDLKDALKTPANADWHEGRNNLLILYASTVDHPERDSFIELRKRIDDPEALAEAQQILIRSGAVSYAMYNMMQRNRAMLTKLEALPLTEPHFLTDVSHNYSQRLSWILSSNGIEISAETLLARTTPA